MPLANVRKMMKKRFNDQTGQTLIEAIAALGVGVVVVTAIVVVVISALNNAQFSKNQNLAAQYAQQGMEIMRQMRDSDWSSFSLYGNGSYCLDKDTTTLFVKDALPVNGCSHGGSNPQNVDVFARRIDIEENSSDCSNSQTKVLVSVSWSDNKCTTSNLYCHKVDLVSCFSDFGVVVAP